MLEPMKRLDPDVSIWPPTLLRQDVDESRIVCLTGKDWNRLVERLERLERANMNAVAQQAFEGSGR